MTPQEKVAEWAKGEIGYVPPYGKFNKYAELMDNTDFYNGAKNGYDWCDIFADCDYVVNFGVETAAEMTNQPFCGCGAGCSWSASYYRAANQWSNEPSVGAQIFFGPQGSEYHTGIVVGYNDEFVYTVEGNAGYNEGYSGGAVRDRKYYLGDSVITGYGIPNWSLVGGEMPATEETNIYEKTGFLDVDGFLGTQSVTAWQNALDCDADGYVSGQYYDDWHYTPNLIAAERTTDPYGSELAKRIQSVVGADVDGFIGPQTVRMLQVWLRDRGYYSGAVDGILGPETAIAVQCSLNDGVWSR